MLDILANIYVIIILVFIFIIVPIVLVMEIIDYQQTKDNNLFNNFNSNDSLNQSWQNSMDVTNQTILGIP